MTGGVTHTSEGVVLKKKFKRKKATLNKSPTTPGVWIEIRLRCIWLISYRVTLHAEGVD